MDNHMMASFPNNVEPILNLIVGRDPKRILDIGSAFGKFSLLIRESILSVRAERGNLTPTDDLEIDCVEMAKYFQNLPYHANLYQNHYHMDARDIDWKTMPKYDLVLLIDVIEHWTKEEGIRVVADIKKHTGARVLISTPRETVMYEEEIYGADCPNHKSQWLPMDFYKIKTLADDYSTICSYIFLI
jgi:2-polyprenyl-3-methyl-5-hydroxy-6-metoxy-1,4-benzoquinol methylase